MAKKHGLSKTPEYFVWKGLKKRCLNSNASRYKFYGGRGIRVCDGINESFVLFLKIVGNRPEKLSTIDRIDNEGHYSCGQCNHCRYEDWPMNIQWATHKENCRHTRKVRWITYQGETKPLSQWAEELRISRFAIAHRLNHGWSVEDALTTPIDMIANQPYTLPATLHPEIITRYNRNESLNSIARSIGYNQEAVRKVIVKNGITIRKQGEQQQLDTRIDSHLLTHNGRTQSVAQWSRETGISPITLFMRIRRGWSAKETLTIPVRSHS